LLILTGFVVHIGDVEAVILALDRVFHFEVKPLSMIDRLCVFAEDQIVLVMSNSVCLVKVAALKSAFENQGFVIGAIPLMMTR
jgi:hypothetical protein